MRYTFMVEQCLYLLYFDGKTMFVCVLPFMVEQCLTVRYTLTVVILHIQLLLILRALFMCQMCGI